MEKNVQSKTVADYLLILKRKSKLLAATASISLILSVVTIFLLPSVYLSTATILIEQQEIPQDYVKSSITSFADQRLQVISQRVMTRGNLNEVVKKFNLYDRARNTQPLEEVLDKMREDIRMETISADVIDPRSGRPTQATIAFTLSYENSSPQMAQQVANELVSLYLNENIKSRSQVVSQTSQFLTEEVDKLSEKIAELESKLAQFKNENANQMPELSSLNMQMIDRAEQQLLEVDRELRTLYEQKIYVESELSHIKPNSGLFTEAGEKILSPADKLKVLETKYLSLSAVYSESHPDMQRMAKEIAALKNDVGSTDSRKELQTKIAELEADLQGKSMKYSPSHPDVVRLNKLIVHLKEKLVSLPFVEGVTQTNSPDNPVYIKLQAQLEATSSQIRSLNIKKADLRKKISMYESRLTATPLVEKDYRTLNRDYENAWTKYRELKAKQMEAKLAESLESERKGERFTLIEPPDVPQVPNKPNRPALLLLSFVGSIAFALGLAIMLDTFDSSIRSDKEIIEILDIPPIGKIPFITTDADILARKRKLVAYATAGVGVVFLAILSTHFGYKPLDVLWFVAMRKVGLS